MSGIEQPAGRCQFGFRDWGMPCLGRPQHRIGRWLRGLCGQAEGGIFVPQCDYNIGINGGCHCPRSPMQPSCLPRVGNCPESALVPGVCSIKSRSSRSRNQSGFGWACTSMCNQGAQIWGSVPCSTQELKNSRTQGDDESHTRIKRRPIPNPQRRTQHGQSSRFPPRFRV